MGAGLLLLLLRELLLFFGIYRIPNYATTIVCIVLGWYRLFQNWRLVYAAAIVVVLDDGKLPLCGRWVDVPVLIYHSQIYRVSTVR